MVGVCSPPMSTHVQEDFTDPVERDTDQKQAKEITPVTFFQGGQGGDNLAAAVGVTRHGDFAPRVEKVNPPPDTDSAHVNPVIPVHPTATVTAQEEKAAAPD